MFPPLVFLIIAFALPRLFPSLLSFDSGEHPFQEERHHHPRGHHKHHHHHHHRSSRGEIFEEEAELDNPVKSMFKWFTTSASGASSRPDSHGKAGEWNDFLAQWNNFLQDYHKDHQNGHEYHHHHHRGCHGCGSILGFLGFGLAAFIAFKLIVRFIRYRRSLASREGGNTFALTSAWKRSYQLRFRFWKRQLFKRLLFWRLKHRVATVEIHQDRERKTYAFTIPKHLVPRINIEWQETGVEASTTAGIVIGVLPEALDCRTGFSRVDRFLAYVEADNLFDEGVLLPLATIPIPNPSAIDPGDVVAFWEDQPPVAQPVDTPPIRHQTATTIPLDPPARPVAAVPENDKVDDRLLYIRIPNTGTRITDIPIATTQPPTSL